VCVCVCVCEVVSMKVSIKCVSVRSGECECESVRDEGKTVCIPWVKCHMELSCYVEVGNPNLHTSIQLVPSFGLECSCFSSIFFCSAIAHSCMYVQRVHTIIVTYIHMSCFYKCPLADPIAGTISSLETRNSD